MYRHTAVILALLLASSPAGALGIQRAVKVSDAWIQATPTEASAFAIVENGTMYDVYLVGASSDVAASVQLVQTTGGKTTPVKEVAVASFDRLQMSPDGTFLKLLQLKRPLKTGESITITLQTDAGEQLPVTAVVK
jgi:copper(I)-binding protein